MVCCCCVVSDFPQPKLRWGVQGELCKGLKISPLVNSCTATVEYDEGEKRWAAVYLEGKKYVETSITYLKSKERSEIFLWIRIQNKYLLDLWKNIATYRFFIKDDFVLIDYFNSWNMFNLAWLDKTETVKTQPHFLYLLVLSQVTAWIMILSENFSSLSTCRMYVVFESDEKH